ncbi:MAG: gliding motility-associated C-terminal domain-containing protein [Bacteroidota bacterium]
MTKRIIPLTLFTLCALFLQAQTPETIQVAPELRNLRFTCGPGQTPFAGTTTQALRPTAQSDDVLFLCKGDSMDIIHAQDFDFSGDPNPGTPSGIGYVFYECAPTITGPQLDNVETDPCLELNPAPPMDPNFANFWVFTDDSNPNGNTIFSNTDNPMTGLSLQDIFNGGAPYQAWFAPITIDNYPSQFEVDGNGVQGGCIHANVNDAFSIVYLNEIEITNITANAGGNGCTGTFDITGGRSEWDASPYSLIDVRLVSNPAVRGYVEGNFFHGETVQFVVDQPGLYEVTINDRVSCEVSFQVNMGSCVPLELNAPDELANPGDNICLDITVQDFTQLVSTTFNMSWDNSILQFTGINGAGLNIGDIGIGPPAITDSIIFVWLEPALGFSSVTLNDGDVAFQICFDVIGMVGDVSPVDFRPESSFDGAIISGVNNSRHGFSFSNGSVRIISGNLFPSVTSCGTTTMISNGSFNLTMQGGTAPYNYVWVNLTNTTITGNGTIATDGGSDQVSNLAPGEYEITITDASGDVVVIRVTVVDSDPLFVQTSFSNPSCPNSSDGTITAMPLGGVGTLSYEWSIPGNTDVIMLTGLPTGTYTVTVTDENGCSGESSQGINVPAIAIDTIVTHVTCDGNGADGAIAVQARGGNGGPYTYNWSNSATGPSISNLAPGNYCVSVQDVSMCEAVFCIDVLDAMRPMVTGWDSVSVLCASDMNGELTVNAVPGNAPITGYAWSVPGVTGPTATGLSAGTYTVTITASDGCTTVASESLFAPPPLAIDTIIKMPPNCPDLPNPNGSINAFIVGGTLPYTYEWSVTPSPNGQVLSGLAGNMTYGVTITDANNCETLVIDTIFLPDPPRINIVFDSEQAVSCNNGVPCDGSAQAQASGGTAGTNLYDFNWASGESDMDVVNSTAMQLCQGWNILEVNDGNCSVTDSVFIDAPAPLLIDTDSTFGIPPSCFGGTDGGAMVKGDGGTPGYTYQWSTMDVGQMISGVSAGTYTVTITDANMCEFVFPIDVREPELLVAEIDTVITMDVSCQGDTDGQISVIPTGGTPPFNYTWSGMVSTSNVAVNLAPGTYGVTVTDANGCTAENAHTISSPPRIFAVIPAPPEPPCFGESTVVLVDTAFGGAGGLFTFSVDNGPQQMLSTPIRTFAGQRLVSVFDQNGCSFDTTITITQPPAITVSLTERDSIELGDSLNVQAQVSASLPIDTIIWTPDINGCANNNCSAINVKPLTTTEYTVTVIDTSGCSATASIIIDVDKNRNVYIPNIFTPNEDGLNDFFKPFIGPGVVRVNFMRVFDRWGEVVFENTIGFVPNNDISEGGWNGQFKGKFLNPGVYVYLIEVQFIDDLVLLYRGDVTLLR